MKYLTVIRDFLQHLGHEIPEISNAALGLIVPKTSGKALPISEALANQMSNPIAKILLELQMYFGLTRSEAMRLHPVIHLQEQALWITRDMASNSRDRRIPFRTDKQLHLIQHFKQLCPEKNFIDTYGYAAVCQAYATSLKAHGLLPSKNYRYFYARTVYTILLQVSPPYRGKQTLLREMGLKTRKTLWSYLNV